MSPAYTIPRLIAEHKRAYPESCLSERAIRRAIKTGELKAVFSGNRALITLEAFEHWLGGESHG
jgi:hypothetical protein